MTDRRNNFRHRIFFPFIAIQVSIILALFLIFTLFETYPELLQTINLRQVRYYAQKAVWKPDPVLVFEPRQSGHTSRTVLNGDIFSEEYGVSPHAIDYVASYNTYGFRTNSSNSPFDIILLGDSYIEMGERDENTLSEILRHSSGLSTYNFGRAWYGPYQYNEILKRYGLQLNPQYAIYCFFAGNDVENIIEYEEWLSGGDYYNFVLSRRSFFSRFWVAVRDVKKAVKAAIKKSIWVHDKSNDVKLDILADEQKKTMHPDLGVIKLKDHEILSGFAYLNPQTASDELLSTEEWTSLRRLLAEFKAISLKNGIQPIVLYIPTKMEAYGPFLSKQSGENVIKRRNQTLQYLDNRSVAMQYLVSELKIHFINLLPTYKYQAMKGQFLYYAFDSHWNISGRKIAAAVIADYIKRISDKN
jgi:hypothetical protein